MRPPLLLLTAALALAACKNNDQHDNTMNVDENLTAENIVSNDVTAIDAVTGDAANMAAESDMNAINLETNAETPANSESSSAPPAARPARRPAAAANAVAANTE